MALIKVSPYPYQREGVSMIEAFNGRALLADDMGLGKTLQLLHYIRRNPQTLPAVVVCPASVKYHWEREAAIQVGISATVLSGETPTRHALQGLVQHRLVIVNYHILKAWLPYLLALKPQLIGIDECQNIQNPKTGWTKAVKILCKGVPHVVCMSGTPLTNRPKELYPSLSIICPREFASGTDFYLRYCKPEYRPWGWVYNGASRLPELHQRLKASCMIRRLKDDVLKELPQKTREVVPLDIRNRDEYNAAKTNFLEWLRATGGAAKAAKAARAEKLAQVSYLRMVAAKGKVRAIGEWVDDFLKNTNEKIVLFAVHTKMVECLHRRYAHSTVINGAVTGRHRQAAIDTFCTDPNCRVLIGNIKACGTGTDGLQRVCRTAAFVEIDWRPGDHTQAEDRLQRIGQVWPVWAYYLIATNTIEERLCDLIQTKQATIRGVLDGGPQASGGLDILDMLMAIMEQDAK